MITKMKWVAVAVLLPLVCFGQLAWNEYVIDGNAGDPYNGGFPTIQAVDLDGDGDQDVMGYPSYEGIFGWWENVDGIGQTWEETVLIFNYTVSDVADINDDGNLDIVAINYYTDRIFWWDNVNGDGHDMVLNVIRSGYTGTPTVRVIDVDGDGDADVVAGTDRHPGPSEITWWENGNAIGTIWIERTIDSDFEGVRHVNTADVDGDGDADVLAASYSYPGAFAWWSNDDGLGESWTSHMLSENYSGCSYITSADLDNDGDTDILGASYFSDAIIYWIQEDDGTWTENVFDLEEFDYYPSPHEVEAADIDGDGDMDIVTALGHYNHIIMWENVNGDASVWVAHQIGGYYEGGWPIDVADINNDGALDVLAGTHDAGQMKWWEQPLDRQVSIDPTITIVPANGGTLNYNVEFINSTPNNFHGLTYWTEVLLPDGELYGPLFTWSFSMPANVTVNVSGLEQNIPAFAPPGDYAYIANAGSMENFRLTSTFGFSKLDVNLSDGGIMNWNASGLFEIATEETVEPAVMPSDFGMNPVHPNPFNARTSVAIVLPNASDLIVTVYNVTGQQVAELANGQFNAGSHTLTFDASGMASGLYFVRATVPGQLNVTQKVMLVR